MIGSDPSPLPLFTREQDAINRWLWFCAYAAIAFVGGLVGGYFGQHSDDVRIAQLQRDHDWLYSRQVDRNNFGQLANDVRKLAERVEPQRLKDQQFASFLKEASEDWESHTQQIQGLQNQVNDLQTRLAEAMRGPVTDDPTLPPDFGERQK